MAETLNTTHHRIGTVTLANGLTIRYAERGGTEGRPIVFLHGYSDSWYSFRRALDLLAGRRHAFAPDARGHGDSGKPAAGYGLEALAADAVELLDALAVERAAVVGHSLGSFVAQALAIAHPERVERLVLVGSAATVKGNPPLAEFLEIVEGWSAAPERALIREFQTSTVHAPLPEWFLEAIVSESAKLPLRVWREALAGLLAADLTDRLAEIVQPAWVVWGDRDAIFSRADQDALLRRLPNATLSVFGGVGHAPHWERPHEFVRELERFLDGKTPESAVPDAGVR
jgi:pimeloyl-ACP methyl ester carboxylesterase